MQIGKLRHRIEIERCTETPDATGHPVKAWANFASVWAEVLPLAGRELTSAKQIDAQATHQVNIRHCAGVTQAMRVKHGTRYFSINHVSDVEGRGREMQLLCTEAL